MVPTYVAIVLVVAANAAVFAFLYPRLLRRGARKGPTTSQNVPTTATSTATGGPTKSAMEQLASAAAAIEEFRRRNPLAYASVESQLEALLRRYPPQALLQLPPEGRELVEKLKLTLAETRKRGAAAAERELATRQSRARELVEQGELDAAVALLETFPRGLALRSVVARLKEARDDLRTRALAAFDHQATAAQEHLEEGRYDKARAIYQKFVNCRLEEIAARAREALAAIDEAIAEQRARAERDAALLYRTVAQRVLNFLANHDYERARSVVVEALVEPKLKDHRQKLEDLRWLTSRAAEVWANVHFGLRKLKPGDPLRVGGIACRFVSFDHRVLRVRFGDISATRTLDNLTSADLVGLAVRGYGTLTPSREVNIGLFLLAEREFAAARARLEAARDKGADVQRALDLLDRLARKECPTCGGDKLVPCPKCGGKGYLKKEKARCPACGGRGSLTCRKCRGKGRIKCTNCAGRGRLGELPCGVCGGTGWERCPDCGGDGRIRCIRCDGRGYLLRTLPCPDCKGKGKVTCPQCKGRGTLAPPEVAPTPAAKTP